MKFPKVELPNLTIPKVPPIKFPKVNISFTPTTATTTTSAASSTSDATVTLIAIAVCWLLPVLLTHLANWFSLKAKAEVAKKEKEKTEAATRLVENSTYVVVGASTGLGLELTKQLAARGSKVYATVRKSKTKATSLLAVPGDVVVVPGIDVTSDGCGLRLATALAGVTIDVLVHNAGSYDGGVGSYPDVPSLFGSQTLKAVTSETMKAVFDVNTLGPLRVVKALHPQMRSPGGKIALISTQFGSIDDNTSGGSYAYRASKAAANMVGKSVSCDLKERGVSVQLLAPGFVATDFGPGFAALKKMGARDVQPSVKGLVEALDAMTMASTGTFVHCNYGEGLKFSKW